MFGFTEKAFTVVEQVCFDTPHGQQYIERRQPAEGLAYIAVYGSGLHNSNKLDLLFYYADAESLEADWTLLKNDIHAKEDQMRYDEMVEHHCTGYTRSGATIMY